VPLISSSATSRLIFRCKPTCTHSKTQQKGSPVSSFTLPFQQLHNDGGSDRGGGGQIDRWGGGGGIGGSAHAAKRKRRPFGIPPLFAQALPVYNHSLGSNPRRHTAFGHPFGSTGSVLLQQSATDLSTVARLFSYFYQ
jgi:hypothetical protein